MSSLIGLLRLADGVLRGETASAERRRLLRLPVAGSLILTIVGFGMFYGGVMGSFTVERFGTERLQQLTREEIDQRFHLFRELTHLD